MLTKDENNAEVYLDYHENTLFDIYAKEELTTFCIPSHITYHHTWRMYDKYSLKELKVHPANPAYEVFDGALYSKGLKTLLYIPRGKTTLCIPAATETIGFQAFANFCPETVTVQPENRAFWIEDGMLLGDDGKTLYLVTRDVRTLTVPASVSRIAASVRSVSFRDVKVAPGNRTFRAENGVLIGEGRLDLICSHVTQLEIPKDVHAVTWPDLYRLSQVTLAPDHPDFSAHNGAIYTKDGSQLLLVPTGITELTLSPQLQVLPKGFVWPAGLQRLTVHRETEFTGEALNQLPPECEIYVVLKSWNWALLPRDSAALGCCLQYLKTGDVQIKAGSEVFYTDVLLSGIDTDESFARNLQAASWQILQALVRQSDHLRIAMLLASGKLITSNNIGKLTDLARELSDGMVTALLENAPIAKKDIVP